MLDISCGHQGLDKAPLNSPDPDGIDPGKIFLAPLFTKAQHIILISGQPKLNLTIILKDPHFRILIMSSPATNVSVITNIQFLKLAL